MLPKINRIKKSKDFETIFKRSKSFKNNLFILKILKNNLGFNRFGFVVSTKISKKATVRNKIRRRLAEVVKIDFEKIKASNDLVFIALRGIDKKDFSEIKEAVEVALEKLGLISKK